MLRARVTTRDLNVRQKFSLAPFAPEFSTLLLNEFDACHSKPSRNIRRTGVSGRPRRAATGVPMPPQRCTYDAFGVFGTGLP
jgi:hypothetical protein